MTKSDKFKAFKRRQKARHYALIDEHLRDIEHFVDHANEMAKDMNSMNELYFSLTEQQMSDICNNALRKASDASFFNAGIRPF